MKHRATFASLAAAFAVVTAGANAEERDFRTATPIKHLVVIFQENVSFDHYFGTYPKAQNLAGEMPFLASPRTPKSVNNLVTPLDVDNNFVPLAGLDLLNNNPNNNPAAPGNGNTNGTAASNPFRLSPAQVLTADQGHNESPEESAYDNGKMDGFPAWVGTAGPPPVGFNNKALVMGYFDGNTVTALWNYAQHFALNDNNFTTQFGPSTPGAINLISGQANGFDATLNVLSATTPPTLLHSTHEAFGDATQLPSNITEIGDGDPLGDVCSNPTIDQVRMHGKNIGDLLNAKGITWGWFQGGFAPTVAAVTSGPAPAPAVCGASHPGHPGVPNPTAADGNTSIPPADIHGPVADYSSHHEPFMYYASTRNPHHLRPSSVGMIGKTDQANHQYDIADFFAALDAGNLPAVTYVKAPEYQDGHPGYSDPLSEQTFLVQVVNALEQSSVWKDTAIIVNWDDSDGWYDHVNGPIVSPSATPVDFFAGPGNCGTPAPTAFPARCGYGPRIPLLVISPWARENFVDHTNVDQSSSLRFIEENWSLGFIDGPTEPPAGQASFDRLAGPLDAMFDFDKHDVDSGERTLILDPATGEPVKSGKGD
jgi:phospholipase C